MLKIIFVFSVLFISSCALLTKTNNFRVDFEEIRSVNDKKVNDKAGDPRLKPVYGNYKEIVFTTDRNLTDLVLAKGYDGYGEFKNKNAKGMCSIFDENILADELHMSLIETRIFSQKDMEYYLKQTASKELYTYSCVLDLSNLQGQRISFNIHLARAPAFPIYKSNELEIIIP